MRVVIAAFAISVFSFLLGVAGDLSRAPRAEASVTVAVPPDASAAEAHPAR